MELSPTSTHSQHPGVSGSTAMEVPIEVEEHKVNGYDHLAALMGDSPEAAIFRRFGALSAENLLYLQAELQNLEELLREHQKADKESGDKDRRRYALNWNLMSRWDDQDMGEDDGSNQWRTVLQIRRILKEYYDALLQHRRIIELGNPDRRQLKALRDWMERPTRGDVFLTGPDRHIWSKSELTELVSLAPPFADDASTSRMVNSAVNHYHNIIGRHIHKEESEPHLRNSVRYHDETSFAIIKTIITLLACLLPIAAIAVLYVLNDMPQRLGMIALFTGLFAICLNAVTSAGMKDIFSATAAFAAVLVVFIGTNSLGVSDDST